MATLSDGVLIVTGTDGPDRITVAPSPDRGSSWIEVGGMGSFPLSTVRSVVVDSGAGDDQVVVSVRSRGLAVRVNLGDGNDSVRGTPGGERLLGGNGDDTILGRGGPDRIDPGPGRNRVNRRLVVVAAPPEPAPPVTSTPVTPPATTSTGWTLIDPGPISRIDVNAWVARLYELVNAERAKAGLSRLTIRAELVETARIQATQMVQFNQMQHELPGARYPDMRSRAMAAGYSSFYWLGENLAFNQPDPEAIVTAWLQSPSHRENLLFASYTEMGISVALTEYGLPYIALEMGQPS